MADSHNKLGEIFARCWADDAFKERFLADPKAVLAESGFKTDTKMEIAVVENTANKMYITLPAKPLEPGELTDAELEGAAGGAATITPQVRTAKVVAGATTLKVAPNTQVAPASSGAVPTGYCYPSPC